MSIVLSALTQFKEVKAPFDGTIVQRQIDTGNLVTAGSTANTSSLYRLSKDDPMRVFVHAPQSAAAQLMAPDVTAVITSSDQPDLRLEGKVARTAKAIDPAVAHAARRDRHPERQPCAGPRNVCAGRFQPQGRFARCRCRPPRCCFDPADRKSRSSTKTAPSLSRTSTIASDDGNVVAIGSGLAVGDKVALNLSSQIAAGEKVKLNDAKEGDTKSASAR